MRIKLEVEYKGEVHVVKEEVDELLFEASITRDSLKPTIKNIICNMADTMLNPRRRGDGT